MTRASATPNRSSRRAEHGGRRSAQPDFEHIGGGHDPANAARDRRLRAKLAESRPGRTDAFEARQVAALNASCGDRDWHRRDGVAYLHAVESVPRSFLKIGLVNRCRWRSRPSPRA